MRILCFILGTLSIVACAVMVVLGIGADTGASSTAHSLRATTSLEAAAADSASINDTRADAYALAQIFGLVGVAWMVGAGAFAPTRTAGSPDGGGVSGPPAAQQWPAQAPFSPQQQPGRPYGGENPQYPGSGPNVPPPG